MRPLSMGSAQDWARAHLLGDEHQMDRYDTTRDPVVQLAEQLLRRARALDDVVRRYRRLVANANRPELDDHMSFSTGAPPVPSHRSDSMAISTTSMTARASAFTPSGQKSTASSAGRVRPGE
jgi:hypothetical protein